MISSSSSSSWSRLDDKLFERAIAIFREETPDRWSKIAGHVPGKTWTQVRQRYEDLVRDVAEIESGRVELPCYDDVDDDDEEEKEEEEEEGDHHRCLNSDAAAAGRESGTKRVWFGSNKGKEKEPLRRKGIPWTEEEHRLFLIGLQRYGKGDWRSISRNAVVSRTPTQVASHAQKYFLRLNSGKKDKKRSSIHDITTIPRSSNEAHDSNWAKLMYQSIGQQTGPSNPFEDRESTSAHRGFGFSRS